MPEEFEVGPQEEFPHKKDYQALGWAAQGGDRVTIPGDQINDWMQHLVPQSNRKHGDQAKIGLNLRGVFQAK